MVARIEMQLRPPLLVITKPDKTGVWGIFRSTYEVNECTGSGTFAEVALPLNRAPAVRTPGNRRSNGNTHATAAGLIAQ